MQVRSLCAQTRETSFAFQSFVVNNASVGILHFWVYNIFEISIKYSIKQFIDMLISWKWEYMTKSIYILIMLFPSRYLLLCPSFALSIYEPDIVPRDREEILAVGQAIVFATYEGKKNNQVQAPRQPKWKNFMSRKQLFSIRARFRSWDLWVMGPPRFRCATLIWRWDWLCFTIRMIYYEAHILTSLA